MGGWGRGVPRHIVCVSRGIGHKTQIFWRVGYYGLRCIQLLQENCRMSCVFVLCVILGEIRPFPGPGICVVRALDAVARARGLIVTVAKEQLLVRVDIRHCFDSHTWTESVYQVCCVGFRLHPYAVLRCSLGGKPILKPNVTSSRVTRRRIRLPANLLRRDT